MSLCNKGPSKETRQTPVHRQHHLMRSLLVILCLGGVLWQVGWNLSRKYDLNRKVPHPILLPSQQKVFQDNKLNLSFQSSTSETQAMHEFGMSPEELSRMQKALDWASPDQPVRSLAMSTSPNRTTFSIVGLRKSYRVGDDLYVNIQAKDYNNIPKRYGGDFFQAKLFSSNLKASVFGDVVDHHNGSYSVRFLLPWVGPAKVAVRLIHSSEAVQILKKYRDSDDIRMHYRGYFEGPGPNGTRIREVVPCNLKWGKRDSWRTGTCCCDYRDPRTGNEWQCQIPQNLPCDAWVYHSYAKSNFGRNTKLLSDIEASLLAKNTTNVNIKGDNHVISIHPSNATSSVREECLPGMQTPVPAGFYFKDLWTSSVCNVRHFEPDDMEKCLSKKFIYMVGDSTTRQWFEYLESHVPNLMKMNSHTPGKMGPFMAVNIESDIIMHWRFHGLPLGLWKIAVADAHYISNEIDGLQGGPHMVIVINICAHVVFHPLNFYIHRVATIRQAVLSLLSRAPETTVVIRSANTGHAKDVYASDWLYLQMNIVLRKVFQCLPVVFIDVWQMTSCHYTTENVHPANVVVANEVDIFLSFVCPRK